MRAFFRQFAARSEEPEWMDNLNVSFVEFDRCLKHLALVNFCTLAYRPTLKYLRRGAMRVPKGTSLSLLDVGSGGGDMLLRLARWSKRTGIDLRLAGVDLNPFSKRSAQFRMPAGSEVKFITEDIFNFAPEEIYDFIVCSLFTHHLRNDELHRFLLWIEAHAKRGWFINDLHRHPIPYLFIKGASWLFRLDPMVRHDGPISVARAFSKREWKHSLQAAGIAKVGTNVRWYFPFRYCVARVKP